MVSQRNLFFDFAKGLLIFLVVLGHCLNGLHIQHTQGLLDRWINSFHMPAFMFVSGWFAWHALGKGITNIVINKLKRLAIPALIWSFVIFLQRIFMGESISIRLFYDSCRCMWFLWCLLALFIISGILWNSKYRLWLGFCLTVALLLLWPYYPNDLLKHFNIPLHFPIFFFAACISEKVKGNTPPVLFRKTIYLILVANVIIYVWLFLQNYPNQQGTWTHLGILALYTSSIPLCLFILNKLYVRIIPRKICNIFAVLGYSTLGIYALNERFIMPLKYLPLFPINNVWVVIVIAIFITSVCWIITMAIRKSIILKKYTLGEK